jgi:hypothetical protein
MVMNERTLAPTEEEPLFLDEPPDLGRPAQVEPASIEDLFPSEDDLRLPNRPHRGSVDWREMNALDPRKGETRRDVTEPPITGLERSTFVLALILAAAILGFAVVSTILK